jgi:hypothetical protein
MYVLDGCQRIGRRRLHVEQHDVWLKLGLQLLGD